MPGFPKQFIEDVKTANPILTAISRRHKMRKKSGSEYQAIDDPSLTCNARTNLWYDFGRGHEGGDVITWEMAATGCTFDEAVRSLAKDAGLPLPRDQRSANGHAAPRSREEPPPPDPSDYGAEPARRAQAASWGEPVAIYPYRDADGAEIYQVARFEWADEGRPRKAATPRRELTDEPGVYAWGMKEGTYLRGKNGDFYYGKDWKNAEPRVFEATAPILYRLPELLEEVAQDAADQQVIFVPEGEKDADTLAAMGFVATTSMGGTNGWQNHFADYFGNADVVIPMDNDAPGRKFAHEKAHAIKKFARRVRLLDLTEHWHACPDKGDITDWRNAGGTTEQLLVILDKLTDWAAEPPISQFHAVRFIDLEREAPELEWLIKGVLTRGEVSIWYGQWGSGKSFLMTDAAFAIALGKHWMGQRTRPGLVIYQAGEGGLGLRQRMRAYRKHNHISPTDNVPFVMLPCRVDIFTGDADVGKLIAEIKAWKQFYDIPLELVVIDTLNAATPGADENSGKDIGPVLNRCRRISVETGAHVALVDHTPKDGGSPRGWSGKMGNVDNAICVIRHEGRTEREQVGDHYVNRDIRELIVTKQKDAPDRLSRTFVLKQVVLGIDQDGDELTSCIVAPTTTAAAAIAGGGGIRQVPFNYLQLNPANEDVFRSLVKALNRHGRSAPGGIEAPAGAQCVTVGEWQDQLIELQMGHEEITDALRGRIKARIYRASRGWAGDGPGRVNLIGKHREWVWRTTRKVFMVDEDPPKPKADPTPLLAAGERPQDIEDIIMDREPYR
jgi:hypothetical protein